MSGFDPNAAASPDSGLYGLPHTPDEAQVVVVPVPWEATTSYRAGTARGPSAILRASKQVDLFDVETGRPYDSGIAMLDTDEEIVAWNAEARALAEPIILSGGGDGDDPAIVRVNALSARLNERVYGIAKTWLERRKLVALLGGDHSTPFGLIRAVAEKHKGMGVLHLDAHADLRDAYEGFTDSHASIMFNVCERIPEVGRLVQVAIRDLGEAEHEYARARKKRIHQYHDATLAFRRARGDTWGKLCDEIVGQLPAEVYLSFDIDGLEPSFCPHTGTPVPGGLSFSDVCVLLRTLVESRRRIVGLDLNEVAPSFDDGDEWDANVGARLLYKMIGWALVSRTTGAAGG
jgi:agmatinase